MSIALDTVWRPHPKQALFLACPVWEVMYGGSKGGGKTDALLMDHVAQHARVHAHWEQTKARTKGRAIILRKEFGRLKDFIQRAHHLMPVISGGDMRWKELEHTWFCLCGYRLEFGHLEGPQDHHAYHGQEFSRMGIDQVEEIPYEQYAYMKAQIRTSEALLQDSLAIRCTANPLGRYASWVKKRFIDPAPSGLKIVEDPIELDDGTVVRMDRVFIPAGLKDNPSLPKEYAANLMTLPEHQRRAFLDGDWSVTVGSFFGEHFQAAIHVIDDLGPTEIRIPSNWPVFRCADWGSRSPSACYWITVDNDGLLIVLDELYGPGVEPIAWGKKLLAVEEKWGWLNSFFPFYSKLHGYLDPSCFNHDTSGGPKIADKLFELGLSWFPGDNERKAGWVELRRRLTERGGPSGKVPGIRICRRCTKLIEMLPNIAGDENDPDDVDTKLEDHALDAVRYGVMSRPRGKYDPDADQDDEIKRWERIMLNQKLRGEAARNATTGY